MTRTTDDTELLRAFQHGNTWADKAIFDRFFEPLVLYSQRITGDLQASEDIALEALAKALARRGDFPSLPQLKSFLYQVAHNASINAHVSQRRNRDRYAQFATQQQTAVIDLVPETEVIRAEILQEIYREVDNLPDKCRQIFKMIFTEGLSTDIIATRLNIDQQTVRSQKSRAISLIRTALLRKHRIATLLFFHAALGEIIR